MPEENGLDIYRADNSGPLERPCVGTNIPPHDRIDYIHHKAFQRGLVGPGLAPTTSRFHSAIRERIMALGDSSVEWRVVDDLFTLVGKAVSAGLTEAVFGPSLLRLHPDFIDNIWAFDGALPWLVRMIPRWVNPRPHRARDKALEQIRGWHSYANQKFREDCIGLDESDPYWGSEMVRCLRRALDDNGKHSDEAMAAHDLGLIWG